MKLNNIKKDNTFSVPENYFVNFYDRLQDKLVEEPKVKKLNFGLYKVLKPVFAIAAMVIIVFMLVNIEQSNSIMEVELTEESYFIDIINEMDEYTFAEMIYSDYEEELNSDDLEEYVLDNISEFELFTDMY